MATPQKKLAQSLEALKKLQDKGWTCNKKSDIFLKDYATFFNLLNSCSTSIGVL